MVVDNFISHEHAARVRAEALAFYRQGTPRSLGKAGHDCTDDTDSSSKMCCAEQGAFRKRPGSATTVQNMLQVCLWSPACPQLTSFQGDHPLRHAHPCGREDGQRRLDLLGACWGAAGDVPKLRRPACRLQGGRAPPLCSTVLPLTSKSTQSVVVLLHMAVHFTAGASG